MHEIGHYFGLYHTQGKFCTRCGYDLSTGLCPVPGDDEIDDTLPDLPCWDQNQIAMHSYGESYANLSGPNQTRVDNVFFNIMSYHSGSTPRLTSDQLDRWTDTANGARSEVTDGRTVFVDARFLGTLTNGSSGLVPVAGVPYQHLQDGIAAASAGDIVLIRPGTYTGSFTVTKTITFRATRGNAIIGPP